MKHTVVIVEDDPSDHSNFQEKINNAVIEQEDDEGNELKDVRISEHGHRAENRDNYSNRTAVLIFKKSSSMSL